MKVSKKKVLKINRIKIFFWDNFTFKAVNGRSKISPLNNIEDWYK